MPAHDSAGGQIDIPGLKAHELFRGRAIFSFAKTFHETQTAVLREDARREYKKTSN